MNRSTRKSLEVLKVNPDDQNAFAVVEAAYMAAKDWNSLIELFEKHSVYQENKTKKYWQRLISELEIIAKEESIASNAEECSQIFVQIGQIWEKKANREDLALKAYQYAFKISRSNGEALDLARAHYARRDNWQMVARLYVIQLQIFPESTHLTLRTALASVLYHHMANKEDAEQNLKYALQLDPNYQPAINLLALVKQLSPAEEIENFQHAIHESVGLQRFGPLVNFAEYIIANAPEGVVDPLTLVEQALILDPSSEHARQLEYSLLENSGSWELLADRLENRILQEVDREKKSNTLLQLANVQLRFDEQEAVATFREVLRQHPTHEQALEQASKFYEISKNWKDLIQIYEKAIRAVGRGAQSV